MQTKYPKHIKLWLAIVACLGVLLLAAIFSFRNQNLSQGIALLVLPFAIAFIVIIFRNPSHGFWAAFIANYFVMGISRYLPGPLGLSVDGLLVLTWLSLIFSQFNRKIEWKQAWNGLTIAAILWFLYAVFELFNPEVVSREAWFYAMRGVSFYMVLCIPLVFLIFNKPQHLTTMIKLWAWFTLIGVGKGVMQKFIGPDPWEHQWLAVIGGKTHLLPQGLRVFSFFTDAATYGGSMGFSGVVFTILSLNQAEKKTKLFFGIVAIVAFVAMMLSGTRGAIAVPFAGFALYMLLSKNIKIMLIGGLVMCTLFVLLKFTTLGNNVYEIRRFRGGLSKDNDSFQVRLENQRKLKAYLASRPFGGGIGSAGNWGLRFSPNTFLAQTPTDSWYVQIWAEQGPVGLYLHISILLFVLVSSARIIMLRLKTQKYKSQGMALSAGMFGIMAASYGSGALGQMPNGLIVYMSMAFIFMMPRWETEEQTPVISS